jgi:hypothetical protein
MINEEDISKTTFITIYMHYEFMVVQFGLSNAPVFFTCLMNGVFKEYLGKFMIVFLDDILIYSKTKEEHEKNLRMVLQVLREQKLYANISKCIFYQKKIHYLGHIISANGKKCDIGQIIHGYFILLLKIHKSILKYCKPNHFFARQGSEF